MSVAVSDIEISSPVSPRLAFESTAAKPRPGRAGSDFGTGSAGLGLLSKFQPDIVKLDMELIRDIDKDPVKRTIVRSTLGMLRDLGVEPVCEGIETGDEHDALRDLGVSLMQGYLLAKPAIEAIPRWQGWGNVRDGMRG